MASVFEWLSRIDLDASIHLPPSTFNIKEGAPFWYFSDQIQTSWLNGLLINQTELSFNLNMKTICLEGSWRRLLRTALRELNAKNFCSNIHTVNHHCGIRQKHTLISCEGPGDLTWKRGTFTWGRICKGLSLELLVLELYLVNSVKAPCHIQSEWMWLNAPFVVRILYTNYKCSWFFGTMPTIKGKWELIGIYLPATSSYFLAA